MRAELAQLIPRPRDLEANTERVAAVVAASTADLVVFPELFLSGYQLQELDELAVAAGDQHVEKLRGAARAANRAVIVGAIEIDAGRLFNSVLCIDRDGSLAGCHRKTHLFGREREAFEVGDRLEPILLAGRMVGPMICFEIEFPEVARALTRQGADLLVTVSANMDPYGTDHELFGRVRALENNLPHLYVNRGGEESGCRFTGESRVIDAIGETVAVAGLEERQLVREVPPVRLRGAEAAYLPQLRPELYNRKG